MNEQQVILVNEKDEAIGIMEKMEAHKKGLLHRAFSIFVFDTKGKMLLQKRSPQKYHGGQLWTNACCSHPYPDEVIEEAAQRRLKEELGFNAPLKKLFSFTYHSRVENNLIEYEYDHVFAGEYEGKIEADKKEVADYIYEDMEQLKWAIDNQPQKFTSWFKIVFPKVENWWQGQYR